MSNSKPVNPKDRTVKCQTCLGVLMVKNGMNEIPVCYGLRNMKEVNLSELQHKAKKMHAYQYEKSAKDKTTSLYFGLVGALI